ncbi:hypothetical protein ANRL3_02120 [Anaerolineae bacterium]|nr:hypothetical protein ANRL3_02120 [Anaerolineae bacterium]
MGGLCPHTHTMSSKHTVGIWSHTTVSRIVQNETYCGVHHYGKVIENQPGKPVKRRSKDQSTPVEVPPIIDRAS